MNENLFDEEDQHSGDDDEQYVKPQTLDAFEYQIHLARGESCANGRR